MPCVLRASVEDGESLERFLRATTLPITKVYRPGELGFRTIRGKRRRVRIPSVNIHVAGGGWDSLVDGAVRVFRKGFLVRHAADLRRLRWILHSSGWVLDFGVQEPGPDIAIECHVIPVDVIRLAAAFEMQLELSIYRYSEVDRRRTKRSTGRGTATREK